MRSMTFRWHFGDFRWISKHFHVSYNVFGLLKKPALFCFSAALKVAVLSAWSTVSSQASVTFFSSSSQLPCAEAQPPQGLVEHVESALVEVALAHLAAHVEGLEADAVIDASALFIRQKPRQAAFQVT